ncbi:MAG: formate-dependent phosphoribosylglycinamide formyltransferase, partial [Planctomycetota bacterium]
MKMPTLMLLGSGELGKEVAISAKRLGCRLVAVDSYPGAPAMQVADAFEVVNMLDGDALEVAIRKHNPTHIVPEVEAIRTERLIALEEAGFSVIPSARAANLTMNRDAIRDVAARKLKLPTAKFAYAESATELAEKITGKGGVGVGIPCVVKPVMSSSGKGQSVIKSHADIAKAWDYACDGMRGDTRRVIVEQFIDFAYEITLLTIRQRPVVAGKKLAEKDRTIFVRPIGHRQERGDYQESWMPCPMKPGVIKKAQQMARAITAEIAKTGAGLFGVEFFITKKGAVIFSELSPRPHDTGMVTMISQDLSEFDLHVRAILGLPIPTINYVKGAAASAVILAGYASTNEPAYPGLDRALALKNVNIRLFGKPSTRKYRRMGVALATAPNAAAARKLATKAAALVVPMESRPVPLTAAPWNAIQLSERP